MVKPRSLAAGMVNSGVLDRLVLLNGCQMLEGLAAKQGFGGPETGLSKTERESFQ